MRCIKEIFVCNQLVSSQYTLFSMEGFKIPKNVFRVDSLLHTIRNSGKKNFRHSKLQTVAVVYKIYSSRLKHLQVVGRSGRGRGNSTSVLAILGQI